MEDNAFGKKYVRLSWQFKDNCLSVRESILDFLEDYIDRLLSKKLIENNDCLTAKTSIAKLKLHRFRDNSNIIYRCAIAYELASILSLSPLEVARQIIEFATTIESDFSEKDRQILAIEISPPGWIDFCLDELFLANWLQKFEQVQGTASTPFPYSQSPSPLLPTPPTPPTLPTPPTPPTLPTPPTPPHHTPYSLFPFPYNMLMRDAVLC